MGNHTTLVEILLPLCVLCCTRTVPASGTCSLFRDNITISIVFRGSKLQVEVLMSLTLSLLEARKCLQKLLELNAFFFMHVPKVLNSRNIF